MIGKTVSHYKIIQKLGEGGMGVVYKAHDTELDRTVALKFLPHGLTADESEQARFLQEAKAASALNHPNICTIHTLGEHEGERFIVMEFVDGKTLRALVPVKRLHDAIGYAIQIAEALQDAHSHGIVHRDIKADNIMVNAKNQVKVMDFGLAKLKGSLKLTKTSSTIGTLAYMAPEQIEGGEVDARSDIFSFGIVLYEMLTGHLPFRGEHEAAMMYAIVNQDPEPLKQFIPDAPSELLHILDRAMEKDREDRYQSAHDMLIDLRRLKKDSSRVSRSPSTSGEQMHPAGRTRITPISKTWKSTTAVLLGIAIVAAAAYFWSMYHSSSETIPFRNRKVSRLTNWGQTIWGTISPDGRFVACTRSTPDSMTLYVLQVDAPVQGALPLFSTRRGLGWTSFSNDGLSVYFAMASSDSLLADLYRIPVLGGHPTLVLRGVAGPATFSPDGSLMAFMRYSLNPPTVAMIIANSDGTNQRTLCTRKSPDRFSSEGYGDSPSWSPDGRTLAAAAGSHIAFGVLLVSVSDGSTKWLTSPQWRTATRLIWLPGGRGVVLSAKGPDMTWPQLWYVSYPEGQVSRVTDDLQIYGTQTLSLSRDGKKLVTTIASGDCDLWVVPYKRAGTPRQLTTGFGDWDGESGLAITPDGSIIFTSESTGSRDIWVVKADGSDRRQLTTGKHSKQYPRVTRDGRQIVFDAIQSGLRNIWRMDIDGTNLKQLTFDGGRLPRITVDGMVYYEKSESTWAEIWKVPIAGGTPIRVGGKLGWLRAVAPEGKLIVYSPDVQFAKTVVVPTNGGEAVASFDGLGSLDFGPDGRSLVYELRKGRTWQLWEQPLPRGTARRVLSIDLPTGQANSISYWALSPDGRTVVYSNGPWQEDIHLFEDLD